MKKIIFFLFIICFFVIACAVNNDPPNPYDEIDYDVEVSTEDPDPESFIGLHNNIFSSSCSLPACHDGTFEPDFRTVQSSYNTLVYHTVKKNYDPVIDGRDPMPYRVTPGDAQLSMMYHRITEHNPPNFERMPSSGNQLQDADISAITNWINNGAKDIYGNNASLANQQPSCYGVLAYLPNLNNYRLDSIRVDGNQFNPFVAPLNQDIEFWFLYADRIPGSDDELEFGNLLNYHKIKLSKDVLNFDDAVEIELEVSSTPKTVASVFSQAYPFALPHYQKVTINLSDYGFQSGDLVFLRSYVRDADHTEITEIPTNDAQFVVSTYFSFYVN